MKTSLILIAMLFYQTAFCQSTTTIVYDANGNIISGSFIKTVPPYPGLLTDSVSHYSFTLDSSHIYVTAYDSLHKQLWKTDPYPDNKITPYRTKRPVIVNIFIGDSKLQIDSPDVKNRKVLWIQYSNTQFGYLELLTGKYDWMGQD
jgi:hypothetical protein